MSPLVTITVAAIALAYMGVGYFITQRAMSHVRANAMNDETYFVMAIQDGGKPSLSMILPKLTVVFAWPVMLALALVFREPYTDDIAAVDAA